VKRSNFLGAAWRLIIVALCVRVAPLVFGQAPPNATPTKPGVSATQVGIRPQDLAVLVRPVAVPALFGMNRVEVARVLEGARLKASFSGVENGVAVEQKPSAGMSVAVGSAVAITLGEMPRLVLSGPAAPAYAGSELTFSAAFVPPLPVGPQVTYYFGWGDGSAAEGTANAVVTHRFADAANRVVSVVAVINQRFKIGSRVVVEVLAPPVTNTVQTATVLATSDTTATVATEGATDTTPTSSTTSSVATDTTATTTPTTTTAPVVPTTSTTAAIPTPNPSSNLLLLLIAAGVVLLLVVTFLLAKVLRALNRKPPEPQAKSVVAFNGGMRAIEYEIEHPELIRRAPSVGLRGGIRAEEGGDV
jgi:hypothetical protein